MVRKIKTLYNLITFGNNFLLVNGMKSFNKIKVKVTKYKNTNKFFLTDYESTK